MIDFACDQDENEVRIAVSFDMTHVREREEARALLSILEALAAPHKAAMVVLGARAGFSAVHTALCAREAEARRETEASGDDPKSEAFEPEQY